MKKGILLAALGMLALASCKPNEPIKPLVAPPINGGSIRALERDSVHVVEEKGYIKLKVNPHYTPYEDSRD